MQRTDLVKQTILDRPGHVTYTLPLPSSSSSVITITLPPLSSWTSGLHWHETHTEYLNVVKGSALVTVDGVSRTYTERSGVITIPPFTRHEWSRSPSSSLYFNRDSECEDPEDDVVVQEWTDPADGEKEAFFRNLNGIIADEEKRSRESGKSIGGWWLNLQLGAIFWEFDNWPVLIGGPKWLQLWVTHIVLRIAVLVGRCIWGLKGRYGEYTPERLMTGEVNKKE
jgi:quercetin dioxygenase-like cupin family protein